MLFFFYLLLFLNKSLLKCMHTIKNKLKRKNNYYMKLNKKVIKDKGKHCGNYYGRVEIEWKTNIREKVAEKTKTRQEIFTWG